jgi:hypothetical protein
MLFVVRTGHCLRHPWITREKKSARRRTYVARGGDLTNAIADLWVEFPPCPLERQFAAVPWTTV